MGKKSLFIPLILFLTSLFLVIYQYKNISITKQAGIKYILFYPVDYINSLSKSVKSNILDLINTYKENKRLKEQINKIMIERQSYSEIIQENKRLKQILSLKEQEPNYQTTAKIISKGYDRFLQTVIIDKGRKDGIKKDMPVITPKGLVGKIQSVRDNFSVVLLLWDPNFSVAVRLQDTRIEGIVSGTGSKYCTLKYVSPEEDIKIGEVIVTSGLDGIFPKGIPVGFIKNIKKEGIEFFLDITVSPFQDDKRLEEVIIIGNTGNKNS
jgi:rod shape-determining protein MreC